MPAVRRQGGGVIRSRRLTCSAVSVDTSAVGEGGAAEGRGVHGAPARTGFDLGQTVDADGRVSDSVHVSTAEAIRVTPQASKTHAKQAQQHTVSIGPVTLPRPGGLSGIKGVAALALTLFLASTIGLTALRMVKQRMSPEFKRKKTVESNKNVVETIDKYMRTDRQQLKPEQVRGIKMQSGFDGKTIFRKYLWYLLRERKFDQQAVDDLVHLKLVLGLQDSEVAEALKERAERIYKKYGTVMLDVAGMTKAGIERKATCRALFSKLLYLTESGTLLPEEGPVTESVSMGDIFGATSDDLAKLRIVSLYEVDLDRLEQLPTTQETQWNNEGQSGYPS